MIYILWKFWAAVTIIGAYEAAKWLVKKIFWKTVAVDIPEGEMTLSVRRSLNVEADQVIDNVLTSAGMKRVR